MWKTISLATMGVVLAVSAKAGATCQTGTFEGVPFTSCLIDPSSETLRLWHRAPDGRVFGTFDRIDAALSEQGSRLGLAMNGGMYHEDRSAVGLYIEDGTETTPLVTTDGPGNFGLLPNGVFCLGESGALVTETLAFAEAAPECSFASQSGPMLVIDGKLHPRFIPDGTSRYIRNGVGVRDDGIVVLAISDAPVNFHRFARLFRDQLDTPDALYIDGKVSRLYAPDLNRRDLGFPLGPIIGTVIPLD